MQEPEKAAGPQKHYHGTWLSLVERCTGGAEVASSNLVVPNYSIGQLDKAAFQLAEGTAILFRLLKLQCHTVNHRLQDVASTL